METFYNKIEAISFTSDLNNMHLAESLVDELYATDKIPEDFYGNILIAVTEAVTNAIQHGNRLDKNKWVKLSAEFKDNGLIITVEDEGEGFDFEHLPDPTLPENIEKESGRGIFLIKSLADEVVFDNNGSKISFKFYL